MTTIQVRNVSDSTSRALKAKAALEGRSLSDYLLAELERLAQAPSRAELLGQLAAQSRKSLPAAEDMLAAERASR
ncbi:FitA-like ribbon-helix-helix domain-containing protein [Kocuria sp.]|uniref:FitA-like ribbon-helix-helix domain-containing protein n=1 Tax=Kocuria sp. TaxID=1871328 RepID=UPI0026DF587F|nr:antitoxin [Kocuria sp.]MDO5619445.1 antitoxin [Kocuria sp.]